MTLPCLQNYFYKSVGPVLGYVYVHMFVCVCVCVYVCVSVSESKQVVKKLDKGILALKWPSNDILGENFKKKFNLLIT